MLSFRTIEPHTLELLKHLMGVPYLKECRLVGGTALALQYGHRSSVDLDVFGDVPDDDQALLDILENFGKIHGQKTTKYIKSSLYKETLIACPVHRISKNRIIKEIIKL